jgi:hypothetical protein
MTPDTNSRDLAALLLILPLFGCAGAATSLRPRAAADLDCPERQLGIAHLGAGGYRAMGCGRMATYVCTVDRYDYLCTRDSEIEATGEIEATPGDPPPGDACPQCADLCLDVDECGVDRVTVTYDASSAPVDVSHARDETPASRSCVARAALAHPLAAGSYTCASPDARSAESAAEHSSASTSAADESTDAAEPAEGDSGRVSRVGVLDAQPSDTDEAEATARRVLNGQCSAILACTSTPQAAVRLTSTSDGLRIELQGAGDSPESACVRAALEGVRELTELRLTRPVIQLVRCP